MITLRVVKGPGKDDAITLYQEGITIGRGPENALDIADGHVSRQHARISFYPADGRQGNGQYSLRDLGSVWGTMISRGGKEYVLTGATEEMSLETGDEIVLGEKNVILRVEEIAFYDSLYETLNEPEVAKTLQRVLGDELSEAYERVYLKPRYLRHVVEFDEKIAGATDVSGVLQTTVDHLTQVYPDCLYTALLDEDLAADTFPHVAAGRGNQMEDEPTIRRSQTIRDIVAEPCGILYEISAGAVLKAVGLGTRVISPKSVTLDEAIAGMAAPVVVQNALGYFLQIEGFGGTLELTADDLDFLMIIASRAAGRLENIRAMEEIACQREFAMAGAVCKTIIHDLGNVAVKVTGSVGILKGGGWENQNEAAKNRLISMLSYGSKLVRARCDDLIQLGRDTKVEEIDLRELGERALEECTGVFEPFVNMLFRCDDNLSKVPCSKNHIERLLWNLLDNAYKVAHEQKLEQLQLTLGMSQGQEGVRVSVSDDIATGMPEEDLQEFLSLRDRVFALGDDDTALMQELASRMHKAEVRGKQGYGIGSFFFCMAVRQMGGTIDVETGPGGSTFSFTLPAVNAKE